MASLINKARKPKFEVHLTIYDLNNVPLVTGVSFIKWHLPHSISSEHRGRTPKCPIANHRVEYNYGKVIPVRIGIDKNSNLVECPIEFEILQEFSSSGPLSAGGAAGVVGSGTEKINLGVVRINLSEYVEESEALLRSSRRVSYTGSDLGRPLTATSTSGHTAAVSTSGHSRKRSSLSLGGESLLAKSVSSHQTSSTAGDDSTFKPLSTTTTAADVEEGVIRRYLMQDSKINSTLKVGILMIQTDGERNYVAPPLKTAPVFGGIAGLMASGDAAGSLEPPVDMISSGPGSGDPAPDPLAGKPRDLYEIQDVYRRALAASWASQPGEMPADECIEDIFSGGDGFRDDTKKHKKHQTSASNNHNQDDSPTTRGGKSNKSGRLNTSNGNGNGKSPASSGSGGEDDNLGTLRPHHLARLRQHFHRSNSTQNNPSNPTASNPPTTTTAFPAFKDPSSSNPNSPNDHLQPTPNQRDQREVHFHQQPHPHSHRGHLRREDSESKEDNHRDRGERDRPRPRSRTGSDSLGSSMATITLGALGGTGSSDGSSSRGGDGRGRRDRDGGFKKPREVREGEVREDMVAWTFGGVAT